MRQPVCVGCDGRELLTPNSVTAPLTEPHLNAHKRSPKYLRSTRSFTGGRGEGASPGKQPRRGLQAEGRASQAQKSWAMWGAQRASPRWCRASPAAPPALHQEPPWAMSCGLVSSQPSISLCAEESGIILVFTSSKFAAGLGMAPWIRHPSVPFRVDVALPCKGAAGSWQFGALPQSQRSCPNRAVQQKPQGGSSQHGEFQGPRIILWKCFGML